MPRKADPSDKIVDAAMRLAAERGWHRTGLADIAAAAEVGLGELYAAFPSKGHIVARLIARTDKAVLDGTDDALAVEPARDRLFELLMRRFDALAPYREGLRSVMRDTPRDPLSALGAAPYLLRAMAWMLEAAGIPARGLRGAVRVNLLAGLWVRTFRTWLADESADLSATMAALDRDLRRAAPFLGA